MKSGMVSVDLIKQSARFLHFGPKLESLDHMSSFGRLRMTMPNVQYEFTYKQIINSLPIKYDGKCHGQKKSQRNDHCYKS